MDRRHCRTPSAFVKARDVKRGQMLEAEVEAEAEAKFKRTNSYVMLYFAHVNKLHQNKDCS